MKNINISVIRIDGGTQSRDELNQGAVAEYADVLRAGEKLPPVTVYFDGSEHWLADGFHRVFAYKAADLVTVSAEVIPGTCRDAILFSVGANAAHGLRRSNEDKRRAVLTLLNDSEWSAWTDSAVAKACGVNQTTVSTHRRSLRENLSEAAEKPDPRKVITKHGTETVMNVAKIGKTPKRELPAPPPEPESDPNEAADTITALANENEELRTRLAVEVMDASEEEKTEVAHLIATLRRQVLALEAENKAMRDTHNGLLVEIGELKKSCAYWQRQAKKAEA